MEECVDGELQSFKAKGGAYIRKEFFGKYPELLALVEHMSDDELHRLTRGGHDPQKVYNAYLRAMQHTGSPTVILAQTVKGYGLGSAEARNATHSEKKLADQALSAFRTRFDIPIPESAARDGSLYRPADDSEELKYMRERRRLLGGFMPIACAEATSVRRAGDGGVLRVAGGFQRTRRSRPPWATSACCGSC